MRRLLEARSTAVAALGTLVVLIAGGGYALASSGGTTIHACVHKSGGDIYIAKKCAKHDKKITWNQTGPKGATGATGATGGTGATGPQGPGETYINFSATGTSSTTPVTIGTIGAWTLGFTCVQSGSTTTAAAFFTGPAGYIAGTDLQTAVQTESFAFPVLSNAPLNGVSDGTGSGATHVFNGMFVPTSGQAVETNETIAAAGSTTNTCHFLAGDTPMAAATAASAAVSRAPSARRGVPRGLTLGGVLH